MNNRISELEALLNPLAKKFTNATSSIPRFSDYIPKYNNYLPKSSLFSSVYGYSSMGASPITNTLLSFSIALTIIFVILVVIHYGITPIFTFGDSGGGSIPLANTTDGQLVWTEGPVASDLSANVMRILPYGFTIQQDIFVQKEVVLSNQSRVFFYRAREAITPDSSQKENLIETYPESNLLMFLSSNTNDLIVEAITQKSSQEVYVEAAPTVLNIPVGEVFRLTVVFLPSLLEVYINGKLHSSKVLKYSPKNTSANFFGPPDAFNQTVKVMNFKYWDRPLSPGEIKKSLPPPPDRSLFNPDQTILPSTCS